MRRICPQRMQSRQHACAVYRVRLPNALYEGGVSKDGLPRREKPIEFAIEPPVARLLLRAGEERGEPFGFRCLPRRLHIAKLWLNASGIFRFDIEATLNADAHRWADASSIT